MKEKTIITELFEDIEKFGWDLVKDKQNFYLKKEKQQIIDILISDEYYKGWPIEQSKISAEQYYNDTYGEEESN